MNAVERAWVQVKAAFRMRWATGRTWSWGGLGATRFDYAAEAGDGRSNAAAVAVVSWICRTFPEAPVRVRAKATDGDLTPVVDHPMAALLERPNPYYAGPLLWMATLADFEYTGNAYWAKVRSAGGRVVELWWLPADRVEPYANAPGSFVDYYEYRADAEAIRIAPEDVVHFRYGLDPRNPRKGNSPMAALVRELYTDDAAANYAASLLRNMAVPGMVVRPGKDVTLTPEAAEQIKAQFRSRFSGDHRGDPVVMGADATVQILSFSPEQMNLREIRHIPEERISAVYGVPAIVAGLGAGLARSTFSNYAEAREAAYEQCVIPTQRLMAAELSVQLLPDFVGAAAVRRYAVDFDNAHVRVLQPDMNALVTRLNTAVGGGWMTPNEAREGIGLEPLPDGDVLYVPSSLTPTDPAALIPPEPDPMALPPPAPLGALPAPGAATDAPPGKRRRPATAKAVGQDVADRLGRMRVRYEGVLAREIHAVLGRQAEMAAGGAKAFGDDGLTRVLVTWYRRVLTATHALVQEALGGPFDLTERLIDDYLASAGDQIAGIEETTRDAVRDALRAGAAVGEGPEATARRIRSLPAFSAERSRTIARTELGSSTNSAALAVYRASGVVVGVRVLDGDGCGLHSHDDPHKANGVTLTLDEAAGVPRLAHPRCVRAFSPIVDAADLEGAA